MTRAECEKWENRCLLSFVSCSFEMHIYIVQACERRAYMRRETRGSCTLSKCVLQQVWYLKFHEKGSGLNHIAWILDQTSKRNNHDGRNGTIAMCQNQQAHPINVITCLGLLWGTDKHNIPLRDCLSRLSASSESGYSGISHSNTMPIHRSLPPTLLCHAKWCQLPWSIQNVSDSEASTCEVQSCEDFLKCKWTEGLKVERTAKSCKAQ